MICETKPYSWCDNVLSCLYQTRILSRSFVLCSVLFATLFLSFFQDCNAAPGEAIKRQGKKEQLTIHVSTEPSLMGVIYNQVGVAPFFGENKYLAQLFTDSFVTALAENQCYKLVSPNTVAEWIVRNVNDEKDYELQAVKAGRGLIARGMIVGNIVPQQEKIISLAGNSEAIQWVVRMLDVQGIDLVWQVEGKYIAPPKDNTSIEDVVTSIAEKSAAAVIEKLVAEGSIFSTVLPSPEVISSEGGLRSTRFLLQPENRFYTSYQLLRASDKNGPFLAVGEPISKEQMPLVLQDSGLLDDTTYYYTVIGRTPRGLANVPQKIFALTTDGPPPALTSFQAVGNTLRTINLYWQPSQDPNVTGYILYRSLDEDGPFEEIATIDRRTARYFEDFGNNGGNGGYGSLRDDTTYYYTIRARNVVGAYSEEYPPASARTKGAPEPPENFGAVGRQARRIPLFWEPSPDPDVIGYVISRSLEADGPYEHLETVQGREQRKYIDKGSWGNPLQDNVTYHYKIQALNAVDVTSAQSPVISATTKPAPIAVQEVTGDTNLFRSVKLRWEKNPETDIVEYQIYRSRNINDIGNRTGTVTGEETSYFENSLVDGQSYTYRLRAVDDDGLEGAFSKPITLITKPKPSPPKHLSAEIQEEGILLTWNPGKETDIHHYEIMTTGFLATRIGESENTSFLVPGSVEPGKEYHFQVRAVDTDGLVGAASRPVSVAIKKNGQRKSD